MKQLTVYVVFFPDENKEHEVAVKKSVCKILKVYQATPTCDSDRDVRSDEDYDDSADRAAVNDDLPPKKKPKKKPTKAAKKKKRAPQHKFASGGSVVSLG